MGITPQHTSYVHRTGAKFQPLPRALTFGEEPAAPVNPAIAYNNETQLAPVTELLVDPITRKRYGIESPFDDKLLRLNPWDKLKLNMKQNFVTLPKTVYQGLKGDPHYTFSDFLNVTNIPYYLGGAFLALSFMAGRAQVGASRQAVGVGLYYLGVLGANKGIDAFYKAKTGVDLNLKFRKANGDIEKVFASADFPRFDLLEGQDFRRMMNRLGVPDDVSDPKREVQDQVRTMISGSRADKLILGNVLAAIGAGYIARSDAWANTFKDWGNLKNIWKSSNPEGSVGERLSKTGMHIVSKFEEPIKEAIHGKTPVGLSGEALAKAVKQEKIFRYGVFGVAGSLVAAIAAHSWIATSRSKERFESPFITNLSPALAPEQSSSTAELQRKLPGGLIIDKLPRKGVFEVAQRMESGGESASPAPTLPAFPMPQPPTPDSLWAQQAKGGLIPQQGGSFR